MKKLFLLPLVWFSVFVFTGCKKQAEEPATEMTPDSRKVVLAAELIPVKMEPIANRKANVYFMLQEKPYYLNLDDPKVNSSLNVINSAIAEQKLVKLYMYKGSLEIARAEY